MSNWDQRSGSSWCLRCVLKRRKMSFGELKEFSAKFVALEHIMLVLLFLIHWRLRNRVRSLFSYKNTPYICIKLKNWILGSQSKSYLLESIICWSQKSRPCLSCCVTKRAGHHHAVHREKLTLKRFQIQTRIRYPPRPTWCSPLKTRLRCSWNWMT